MRVFTVNVGDFRYVIKLRARTAFLIYLLEAENYSSREPKTKSDKESNNFSF